MLFDKEDIRLSIQEKVHDKIEELRHEMAQAIFDGLNEGAFFVHDEDGDDVVAGPFKTREEAKKHINGKKGLRIIRGDGDE